MVKKYEHECWACHGWDIERTSYGSRCRACNATWCDIPEPGGAVLVAKDMVTGGPLYKASRSSGSPGIGATRRAATARKKVTQ